MPRFQQGVRPTLLILAAGMSSRYGGLKPLDPVGPAGETVLDYAVFDALRSGFDRVVFVVRRDFEAAFRAQVVARYKWRLAAELAYQACGDMPAGFPPQSRTKPWGTGHAVWCAHGLVNASFAVLNADDFYGRDAFRRLAGFLATTAVGTPSAWPANGCMVGYRPTRTLSDHGSVSRGVCAVGPEGGLRSVIEHTAITRTADGSIRATAPDGEHRLTGDETVSMNCWGLPPEMLGPLESEFVRFLEARRDDAKAESYLPAAVAALIARGDIPVRVMRSEDACFGVTFREDRPGVEAAIRRLVETGVYPPVLWPATDQISA